MSLEVKNAHRQAFKEIFSMKAVDGKLDRKGLADLFVMIDYKVFLIVNLDPAGVVRRDGAAHLWEEGADRL